ncbi:MAG: RIP metalloprotease RseP [Bacteriovoracaceae bacterium]|nr:RIP metalloprotease RseP [Bacteriovoracaceae bacterium]
MFIEKVGIFLLFLGPLIFFHELGHYLLAKFAKVKVETFSIGFGPKLFKFRKWGTEFTISLIPLGGYVKMFGDSPETFREIPHDQRHQAYQYKTIMQRFWIVFAGPLFNVLLAFFLFFWIFSSPGDLQILSISQNTKTMASWCPDLKSGDVIKSINDKDFTGFDDMNSWGWNINSLKYQRGENTLECKLGQVEIQKFLPALLESVHHTRPVFIKNQAEYVLSLDKVKNDNQSFENILEKMSAVTFPINLYLYAQANSGSASNSTPSEIVSLNSGEDLFEKLSKLNYFQKNLSIQQVMPNSLAAKAGILKNDILVGLEGKAILVFDDFKTKLQEYKSNEFIKLSVIRNLNRIELVIDNRNNNLKEKPLLLGIMSSADYMPPLFVKRDPYPFVEAFNRSLTQTANGITTIAMGLINLFKTSNALEMVGGPITIAKAASDSWNHSMEYFLRLMALISLNLAVINLFPLPVLDGGHILFLGIEAIIRRRVPMKILEWSYRVGFAMILFLLFTALYNDFRSIF